MNKWKFVAGIPVVLLTTLILAEGFTPHNPLRGTSYVTGDAGIYGNLTVNGTTQLLGGIDGNLTVHGDAGVDVNALIGGTFTGNGASTLTGGTSTGALTVNGNATVHGDAGIDNNFLVGGAEVVTGTATTGALTVNGNA